MDTNTKNILAVVQAVQELKDLVHRQIKTVDELKHQLQVAESNVEQLRNELRILRYSTLGNGPTAK